MAQMYLQPTQQRWLTQVIPLKRPILEKLYFISCLTVHFNPLTTARANKLARSFLAINCQLQEPESCSNPLRIQQVF